MGGEGGEGCEEGAVGGLGFVCYYGGDIEGVILVHGRFLGPQLFYFAPLGFFSRLVL